MAIHEDQGAIYIETHINPSAGCMVVLSPDLSFRTAISGWLIGLMGADYAIVQHSEIHFMPVHPAHIGVLDLKRNTVMEVYPFPNDPQRPQFSLSLKPHISEKWCMNNNPQCDPNNFNVTLQGKMVVNDADKSFRFDAEFDPGGFGDTALKHVPAQTVTYTFRERNGVWEHSLPIAKPLVSKTK